MRRPVLQGTLVLSDRLVPRGQIVLADSRIEEIATGSPCYTPTHNYGDAFIGPGLIDLHVHGIAGDDVMDGSANSIHRMARRFAQHGVTGFLPTTVTQNLDVTRSAIESIRAAMDTPGGGGSSILGIHLEGPFLNPAYKGMQNERFILPPDMDTLRALLRWGGGAVRRASLAPEMPGAHELIRVLRAEGVSVSIAHTGATYEEALEAVLLGATHVTHCFNAMTGVHHRHPGVAGAALLCSDLYAETIADGVHLHPAIVRLLVRAKGRERVMLVTDSMSAADMPDGSYRFGGHDVTVCDGVARLADGTLASSTLTMEAAVRNVVNLCALSVVDAWYMGSTTPASAFGHEDRKGKLVAGQDADLAILDSKFRPVATWVEGQEVWRRTGTGSL